MRHPGADNNSVWLTLPLFWLNRIFVEIIVLNYLERAIQFETSKILLGEVITQIFIGYKFD